MGIRQRLDQSIRRNVASLAATAIGVALSQTRVTRLVNVLVEHHWDRRRSRVGNPVLDAGAKYFSQNDEDGILIHILSRLSIERGVFVEFGVGDGLENNTLRLLMAGWKGAWVGGEPLKVAVPEAGRTLSFARAWVTRDNCVELMRTTLHDLGESAPDLVSVDLDGNDLYVVREILTSGARPEIFVVEYNGKFPPPIRFSIAYDPTFTWDGSDYFGASLQSFVDLFGEYDYLLICCNVTGVNAFFVPSALAHQFSDVSREVAANFVPAAYIGFYQIGHPTSHRTVETFLRE